MRDPYIMNSNREQGDRILFNSSRHSLNHNGGTSYFTQIDVRMIKVVQTTWEYLFPFDFLHMQHLNARL